MCVKIVYGHFYDLLWLQCLCCGYLISAAGLQINSTATVTRQSSSSLYPLYTASLLTNLFFQVQCWPHGRTFRESVLSERLMYTCILASHILYFMWVVSANTTCSVKDLWEHLVCMHPYIQQAIQQICIVAYVRLWRFDTWYTRDAYRRMGCLRVGYMIWTCISTMKQTLLKSRTA